MKFLVCRDRVRPTLTLLILPPNDAQESASAKISSCPHSKQLATDCPCFSYYVIVRFVDQRFRLAQSLFTARELMID